MTVDITAARAAGRGGQKVKYPIRIRELEVLATQQVAPSMRRVTLGGSGALGFESHTSIEHVRLIFPDPGTGEVRLPVQVGDDLRWPRPRSTSRDYSVRRHDPVTGEIDIDLVIHPGGLASAWAESVQVGARIPVAGPPGGYVIADGYDRYLLAADASALPPLARWLQEASQTTSGFAVIEVASAAERIELHHPPGIEVRWLYQDGGPSRLAEVVADTARAAADGSLFVWVAGEANAIGPLRTGLDVAPEDRRITGYWKRGVDNFDDHD